MRGHQEGQSIFFYTKLITFDLESISKRERLPSKALGFGFTQRRQRERVCPKKEALFCTTKGTKCSLYFSLWLKPEAAKAAGVSSVLEQIHRIVQVTTF